MKIKYLVKLHRNETGDVTWEGKRACITAVTDSSHLYTPEKPPFWPPTMEIVQLRPSKELNSLYTSNSRMLDFIAKERHEIFAHLHDKQLYAEIQLPSQTLLLEPAPGQYVLLFGFLVDKQQSHSHPQQQQPHSQQLQVQIPALQPAVCIQPQQMGRFMQLLLQEEPVGQLQEHPLEVHLQQLQPASQLQQQHLEAQQQQQRQEHQQSLQQVQQDFHETLQLLQQQVRIMQELQQLVRQGNQQLQPEWVSQLGNQLQLTRQQVQLHCYLFQSLQNRLQLS